MRLPWSRGEIEELKQELESLREEKQRLEKRFEAEKQRRSTLARKKQEAEEKINRLEDRIHGLESEEDEIEEEQQIRLEDLEFAEAHRILKKLARMESPDEDLITVFSPSEVQEVEDFKGLKNVVNLEQLELLQKHDSFTAFLDPDLFETVLRTRPVFDAEWTVSNNFSAQPLLDFIESEKIWALVSAGETQIFSEQEGSYEELETLKSRVDRKHSKGGYSQDRFERKREEQVQQHLDEVEKALEELENIYLLGQKELCKELSGDYLGGFDPNKAAPEVFYSFQIIR